MEEEEKTMEDLDLLKQKIKEFTEERDWNQFHTPSNLAKSISIEANELLECYQWSDTDYNLEDVKDELADVINYCIQLADKLDVNITDIVLNKLEKTAKKYPVEKCNGKATKYDKL